MIRSNADHARRALRGAAAVALGTLALAACEDETPPPFEVEGTGTVSGLLFYDEGRDGQFEPVEGDSALAGVPLTLRVRGTGEVIPGTETTTDAQGRFTITGVPVGTHDIVFDEEFLEGIAVVCQSPRPVSVRISEVTSLVISSQESCLIPIAQAREEDLGTPVTVRGVVTVGSGDLSSSYFFVQDETAGIKVFTPANAVVGQFVEVSGEMAVFSGELEIVNATITTLGTAPLPDPIVLTGAQFASHEFQGSLALLEDLEATSVPPIGDQSASYNVEVLAPDGTAFIIRVDSDANITPGTFVVGNVYDVIGVVSPFGGAEQLYVRSDADIAAAS